MVLGEFGVDLAPILASAGIVGVAIGFGAQNLVKDFLSGMFMMLEDQYGVGDIVDLGQASGTVEAVGLRITTLRDVNGTVWYVRNGEILRVGNKSQGFAVAVVDVPVAHGTDVAEASEAAARVAQERVEQPDSPRTCWSRCRRSASSRSPRRASRCGSPCACTRRAVRVQRALHAQLPRVATRALRRRLACADASGYTPTTQFPTARWRARTMERVTTPQSFYDEVGGAPVFDKIVARFYEEVAADEVLRPLYPEEDLGPAEERLRMFLEQYWGGPRTYSDQRGHPRLRMRHAAVPDRTDRARRLAALHAHRGGRGRTSTTNTVRNCGSTCSMRPSA